MDPCAAPCLVHAQGYLAEAIAAGHGYSLGALGVEAAALQQVADVCGELLGRRLLWQPAAAGHAPPAAQQPASPQPASPWAQRACQVGGKRQPPCSPGSLAAAAARSDDGADAHQAAVPGEEEEAADSSSGAGSGAAPGPEAKGGGELLDVLQQLVASGHTLRQLKEERFADIPYGHLRLALAHLGRCNPAAPCQ